MTQVQKRRRRRSLGEEGGGEGGEVIPAQHQVSRSQGAERTRPSLTSCPCLTPSSKQMRCVCYFPSPCSTGAKLFPCVTVGESKTKKGFIHIGQRGLYRVTDLMTTLSSRKCLASNFLECERDRSIKNHGEIDGDVNFTQS